jgi:probable HAF family extracellular repeat protein
VLPFSGATAQTYSVIDFQSIGGGSPDSPTAISGNGVSVLVVAKQAFVSDGLTASFIPPLRMYDDTVWAGGINDNELVTGGSLGGLEPALPEHAFVYNTATGSHTDLGTLPGGATSRGYGINLSGQVTGSAAVASGKNHAFLYRAGTMSDLGTLPGGTSSQGTAINDSGVIVGQADIANGDQHAFVTTGASLTDLGTLGGTTSAAYAINKAGQIAGSSSVPSGASHAFLYIAGTMTDLGTLGGSNSSASGLNNSGQVVGASDVAMPPFPWVVGSAFLYANGAMTDLNTLIAPNDPLVGKVHFNGAVGINDNGWIIANGIEGSIAYGVFGFTAFLLIPLHVSPRSLVFNNQPVGTQSGAQTITLTNLNSFPLAVSAITPSSGFTQANDCSAALTNGASCSIQVGFAPTAASPVQSGALNVTTPSGGFTLPVALSGSAYTAVFMKASAAQVNTGVPVTLTWTLYNGVNTCTATGGTAGDGWAGSVSASGSKSVVEETSGTYTYTLTCPVSGVQPQASATVKYTSPASSGGGGSGGSAGGGGGGGELDWLTLGALLSFLVAMTRRGTLRRQASCRGQSERLNQTFG